MPDAGDVLTKSWGVMPITSLHNLVSETLRGTTDIPDMINLDGVSDMDETLREWTKTAETEPGDLISTVDFERLLPELPLVRYELAKRRIVINSNTILSSLSTAKHRNSNG